MCIFCDTEFATSGDTQFGQKMSFKKKYQILRKMALKMTFRANFIFLVKGGSS